MKQCWISVFVSIH